MNKWNMLAFCSTVRQQGWEKCDKTSILRNNLTGLLVYTTGVLIKKIGDR